MAGFTIAKETAKQAGLNCNINTIGNYLNWKEQKCENALIRK